MYILSEFNNEPKMLVSSATQFHNKYLFCQAQIAVQNTMRKINAKSLRKRLQLAVDKHFANKMCLQAYIFFRRVAFALRDILKLNKFFCHFNLFQVLSFKLHNFIRYLVISFMLPTMACLNLTKLSFQRFGKWKIVNPIEFYWFYKGSGFGTARELQKSESRTTFLEEVQLFVPSGRPFLRSLQ